MCNSPQRIYIILVAFNVATCGRRAARRSCLSGLLRGGGGRQAGAVLVTSVRSCAMRPNKYSMEKVLRPFTGLVSPAALTDAQPTVSKHCRQWVRYGETGRFL